MIVFNGKIVSMDDNGVNTSVGHVYEAMAVKGDRIMALGTNQQIQALADSNTQRVDLDGQTVMPGIISTHWHAYGFQFAQQTGVRATDVGARITVQAGKDFESTRLKIENEIQEAVKRAEPEKWIFVGVTQNQAEGVSGEDVKAWITSDSLEPIDRLDRIAPNHPVLVQSGPRANINSKGYEMAERMVPHWGEFIKQSMGADMDEEITKGFVGVAAQQSIQWDITYRNNPKTLLAEMVRRLLERAAANGLTTFGSRVPHPRIIDLYSLLRRENALPVRFGALMEVHRRPADPETTRQFYNMTGNLTGVGDDYLWINGVASEMWDAPFPMVCLGKDLEAPPRIKARELCPKPGDMWYDTLQVALETGWRLAGVHGVGSDAVRRFIGLIERAMANSGQTVEDIRKLHMTMDHTHVVGKLPDVMAGLKKYNIILSAAPGYFAESPSFVKDYGPSVVPFLAPIKTWIDNGIRVVGESGPGNYGNVWLRYMTREVPGGTFQPDEAVDRVTVLKMWTTWASEYMRKENAIGSLEVGKLADFVVLDKDLFTIPQNDIPKIRPQMTVMGGKVRYLDSEYAGKLGVQPVGYQFAPDEQPWGGEPGAG
ncbi:MAG: amidohydrolase family protein [Acidobacteria bacterium]|nr:amidohydrolase family protein [Acidobacteriota bacterium]